MGFFFIFDSQTTSECVIHATQVIYCVDLKLQYHAYLHNGANFWYGICVKLLFVLPKQSQRRFSCAFHSIQRKKCIGLLTYVCLLIICFPTKDPNKISTRLMGCWFNASTIYTLRSMDFYESRVMRQIFEIIFITNTHTQQKYCRHISPPTTSDCIVLRCVESMPFGNLTYYASENKIYRDAKEWSCLQIRTIQSPTKITHSLHKFKRVLLTHNTFHRLQIIMKKRKEIPRKRCINNLDLYDKITTFF